MTGDLTTVERVVEWLSGQAPLSSDNNSLLSRLITSVSSFVNGYIARSLGVTAYDEWYDSGGLNFISLKNYPVRTSDPIVIQFAGVEVSQEATGNPPVNGWLLSPPTRLELRGHCFPRGRSVARVQYSAGYSVEAELHTVPSTSQYTVQTNLVWLEDLGVTLADGTPLTKVATGPTTGEYSVSAGSYTFAAADAGVAVLISYSNVPPDLEQAVIELVGERFKHRDRIGLTQKNLPNGETVGFLNQDMSPAIRTVLERYKNRGAF